MSSDHSRSFALIAAVVILLFFAYVFIGMQKERHVESVESPPVLPFATTENASMENASGTQKSIEESKVDTMGGSPTIDWKFTSAGFVAEGGLELIDVTLVFNQKTYVYEKYSGTCNVIESDQLLPEEISGVLCWWGGAGQELGIFKEGDTFLLKRGHQDEGDAESPGFRGDFEVLQQL